MARADKVGTTATKVKIDGNNGEVTYHWTVVAKWTKDTITLNSDGYRTATTKTRMNQASNEYGLGFYVSQKNHEWFVTYKNETFDFVDGMTLKR